MALIRGVKSIAPCPRCLITHEDLWNPSLQALLRTSAGTQATFEEVKREKLVGKKEEILKSVGLRDVEVSYNHLHSVCTLTDSPEYILADWELRPVSSAII